MKYINHFNKGFSLIELLVVISLISALAGIIVSYTYTAGQKSRDTQRKQNMDQLVKGINMYFADNGTLPRSGTTCATVSDAGSTATFVSNMLPYMKTMTYDPNKKGATGDYAFQIINSANGKFRVCAQMEQASAGNSGATDLSSGCAGGVSYNYCIAQQ
ncbi:MAG: prepilin-type N-terminal cleavage/methylation domain-containing protein [bacterium]